MLAAGAGRLPAQSAHPVLSGFAPVDDYMLEVDGRNETGARLYLSRRAAAMLIVSEALGDPVLLWARTMAVDRLEASDLIAAAEGYDVVAEPARTYVGDAAADQADIDLPIKEHKVRIVRRPSLLGDRTLGELLEHSPGYRAGMSAFTPDPAAVAALRDTGAARVRVFFGSWCGVCKRVLPNLLEVEAGLEGSNVAFEYYGLAEPPAGWEDPEVKASDVTGLPTAIVYRNGAEIGRLTGAHEFARPELGLRDLLVGAE